MGLWGFGLPLIVPTTFIDFSGVGYMPIPTSINDFTTLTVEELLSIKPNDIDNIPVPTFGTLSASVLQVLDSDVLAELTAYQLARMPSDQADLVNPDLKSVLRFPQKPPGILDIVLDRIDLILSKRAWIDYIKHCLKIGILVKFLCIFLPTLVVKVLDECRIKIVLWFEETLINGIVRLYKDVIRHSTIFKWVEMLLRSIHQGLLSFHNLVTQFIHFIHTSKSPLKDIVWGILKAFKSLIIQALEGLGSFASKTLGLMVKKAEE